MATLVVTYVKTVPPLPPLQVGPRLRKVCLDILAVANELGDAGLGGADVTMTMDNTANTLAFAGGNLAATRTVQLA